MGAVAPSGSLEPKSHSVDATQVVWERRIAGARVPRLDPESCLLIF